VEEPTTFVDIGGERYISGYLFAAGSISHIRHLPNIYPVALPLYRIYPEQLQTRQEFSLSVQEPPQPEPLQVGQSITESSGSVDCSRSVLSEFVLACTTALEKDSDRSSNLH